MRQDEHAWPADGWGTAKHRRVLPLHRSYPKSRGRRRGFTGSQRMLVPIIVAGLLLAAGGIGLIDDQGSDPVRSQSASRDKNVLVTWVDGDSGRLDGREFRLHDVDAPEGSPQRAKCACERELSGAAIEAARRLTNGKQVRVSRLYGKDGYGRELVDLAVDGRDVASQLVNAGKLKRWNFDGGERKPDWC